MTYVDFSVTLPLDAPPPAEDEDFESYSERMAMYAELDDEIEDDERWQQRYGWML